MMVKKRLQILVFFIVFMGFAQGVSSAPPNIVLILMDDLGVNSVGCYGSDFHRTPAMDRLADEGLRFTQAYTAAHNCSPTRASILTGLYPARLNLTDWIPGREYRYAKLKVPEHSMHLELGVPTIPKLLKPLGYRSAMIGKWHLSVIGDKDHEPADFGFDVVFEDWSLNRKPSEKDPKGVFKLTERAIEFMESVKDQPFFLMLSHYSVHDPIAFNRDVMKAYELRVDPTSGQKNAKFAAMLDAADKSVGMLLEAVDRMHLAENTVVMLYSDNGGILHHASNAPLRGQKATLYEGGVRVPMIVRWPGVIEPGSVSNLPVNSIDLLPTFFELAGGAISKLDVDGVSAEQFLSRGRAFPARDLFWHYPHYNRTKPVSAIRSGDYKLLHYYEDNRIELYDLATDIGESNNLAHARPEVAIELKAKLDQWRREVGAREPVLNPAFDPNKADMWAKRKGD